MKIRVEREDMKIKEFAEKINGKEYEYPIFTEEELKIAKENGFVCLFAFAVVVVLECTRKYS